MALKKCPDCNQEVSDTAYVCPKCGKAFNESTPDEETDENPNDFADATDAIKRLLNSVGLQAITNQLFTSYGKHVEKETKRIEAEKSIKAQEDSTLKKLFIWRWVFTLLLAILTFISIGVLGYFQMLDKFVIGSLMGAIVGYLFGQAGKQK
jgi:hypothetical protein